jgi:hypothetical protein
MTTGPAALIEMLLSRLERVPADSLWAHRASGVRGSLLNLLESMEAGQSLDLQVTKHTARVAMQILHSAAQELRRTPLASTQKR